MGALTATAQAADTWLICAKEGSTFIVPNTSTAIYYGNNGRYASTVGVTSIKCNNDSFDGDPLKGKDKVCMYDMGDPGSKSWTQCAEEGKDCSFSGAKLVRYGTGSKWAYGAFVNGVSCKNGTFGDPARGSDKTCQVAN